MKRGLFFILTLSLLIIPAITFALDSPNSATGPFQFQPIVSIPLPTGGAAGAQTSLADYVNAVFQLAITVAVVLAVIMIIIDGFKYMTSEAVGEKKGALGGIRSALFGLLIILASYMVLHIINPCILNLNVLSQDQGASSGCSSGVGGGSNTGGGASTGSPPPNGAGLTPPQSVTPESQAYCFTMNNGAKPETIWNFPLPGQTALEACNTLRAKGAYSGQNPSSCSPCQSSAGAAATPGSVNLPPGCTHPQWQCVNFAGETRKASGPNDCPETWGPAQLSCGTSNKP